MGSRGKGQYHLGPECHPSLLHRQTRGSVKAVDIYDGVGRNGRKGETFDEAVKHETRIT